MADDGGENRLLSRLPPTDLERIAAVLDPVRLEPGQTLLLAHEPIRRVIFPDSGLVALSITMHDGRAAGASLVGAEGLIGLPAIAEMGAGAAEAIVQVEGRGRALSAERFRAALAEVPSFRTIVDRFAGALLAHVAQSAACNGLHSLDQRAARWLVLACERSGADTFPLTQEDLADLLGVSRPAVSTVGARFARDGAAEFRRGTVRVMDVSRLEAAACECLEADRDAYRRLDTPIAALRGARLDRGLERGSGFTSMRSPLRRAR